MWKMVGQKSRGTKTALSRSPTSLLFSSSSSSIIFGIEDEIETSSPSWLAPSVPMGILVGPSCDVVAGAQSRIARFLSRNDVR